MKRSLVLLLFVPVLAAACGSTHKTASSTPTSTSSATAPSAMSKAVQMRNYSFSPSVLKGKPGEKLTVNLSNQASVEHNFSVPSENISVNVQPGKKASVQVTFPKSGTTTFFCKFHRTLGMVGRLQVGSGGGSSGSGGSGGSGGSSGGSGSGY